MFAAQEGHLNVVKKLLENGADPSIRSNIDFTDIKPTLLEIYGFSVALIPEGVKKCLKKALR